MLVKRNLYFKLACTNCRNPFVKEIGMLVSQAGLCSVCVTPPLGVKPARDVRRCRNACAWAKLTKAYTGKIFPNILCGHLKAPVSGSQLQAMPADNNQAAEEEGRIPAHAKYLLCSSYAMAAWAWRSWEFIVALVLIELYPNSLLMVSAYGLLDNLARVLLGPAVGSYIDRHERFPGAIAMLRLQNVCIGGSAAAALVLLWPGSPAAGLKVPYWVLMWLLTVLGAASSAGSTGVSISVEREAVKALCGADGRALARLNSVMRAIDLTALLCAPLVAGVLMTAAGPFAAVAVMAAYCGVAYLPEVLLLQAAFRAAPVLGRPKVHSSSAGGAGVAAGPAGAADGAGADERTGLLEDYDDRGADAGAGLRVAAIAEEADADEDAASGPARSCFGGAALTAQRAAGEAKAQMAGSRGLASLQQPEQDSDGEGDLRPGGDSPRLTQPLLLAGADSLPSSVPAGWPDGEFDDSAAPTPGRSRSASAALFMRESSGVPSPGGGGGGGGGDGGGKLSTASSMTALAVASPVRATRGAKGTASAGGSGGGGGAQRAAAAVAPQRALLRALARQVEAYGDSWRVYCRQPVLLLCLALALLYMTVLSLGFLMTSFLKWSGLSEAEVSGYRGIGALTGLAATAIFPPLAARAGLRFCAVAGVTYQLASLAAGVLPVAAEAIAGGGGLAPSVAQVRILVAGLVASRTGLWLYDLAVTQLIQEEVHQDQLGSVYGVQSSLQAAFEMMSFVAGLLNPDPARFHWLMMASLGSVAAAAALVWVYACLRAGRTAGGEPPAAGCSGGSVTAA